MDPVNLAMWRAFGGIVSNKYSKIRYYIPHPVDINRKLFFIADAPRTLIEKLKICFIK